MINFSCQETRLSNKNQNSAKGKLIYHDSAIIKSQLKGIDLIASGNLPKKWNLEIDFDNECYFINEDGLNLKAKTNTSFNSYESKDIYNAIANNNQIEIIVYNKRCNTKNGKQFNSSIIRVIYRDVTYEGCGQFLFDERLHQTWELDYIDNEPQFPINYPKGIPYFKIDLIRNKITGFDGCNNLSSSIEVKGNRIQFRILNKKPDNSLKSASLINEFISNHLVDYFFRENKLVFQLANDTRLTFKLKED